MHTALIIVGQFERADRTLGSFKLPEQMALEMTQVFGSFHLFSGTLVFSHFLIHFHSRSILSSSAAVLPICPAGTGHDQPCSATAANPASSATPTAVTRPKERTQAGRVSQQSQSCSHCLEFQK